MMPHRRPPSRSERANDHSAREGGSKGDARAWLPMLAPLLAALLYPFTLNGFNTSVTHIVADGAGASCRG